MTTEPFTLQGIHPSALGEATGRATMFLGAVSGGPGRCRRRRRGVLRPRGPAAATLAVVGVVAFDRVLRSGTEDFGYAHRIARLRRYYCGYDFRYAPELVDYLLSVSPAERLGIQGLRGRRWQRFPTVMAMVGVVTVVTAMLAGSAAGLLAAVVCDHSPVPAPNRSRYRKASS